MRNIILTLFLLTLVSSNKFLERETLSEELDDDIILEKGGFRDRVNSPSNHDKAGIQTGGFVRGGIVKGGVRGSVLGNLRGGFVKGNVKGNVFGSIKGDVKGDVKEAVKELLRSY